MGITCTNDVRALKRFCCQFCCQRAKEEAWHGQEARNRAGSGDARCRILPSSPFGIPDRLKPQYKPLQAVLIST